MFAWTSQKTPRRKLLKYDVEDKATEEIHHLTPPDQHFLIPKVACTYRCETTSALSPDRIADLSHSSSDDSLMNVEVAPSVISVLRSFQHSFSHIPTVASCCMRRYTTQSHYPDTGPTVFFFRLVSSDTLGNNQYQL